MEEEKMGAKKTRDWKYYLKSLIGIFDYDTFSITACTGPNYPGRHGSYRTDDRTYCSLDIC